MLCTGGKFEVEVECGLWSSYLPLSSSFYDGVLFPRYPDIFSLTGTMWGTPGKTKSQTLPVRRNTSLNFTVVPRRTQHLPTLGKHVPSVKLIQAVTQITLSLVVTESIVLFKML